MLPRVLEPEVMDTPDEARDYDSMDHAEVNRRFVNDLLPHLADYRIPRLARAPRPGGGAKQSLRLLDLGAGTAQIPIELCRRTDQVSIVAVDAARHMLNLANSKHRGRRTSDDKNQNLSGRCQSAAVSKRRTRRRDLEQHRASSAGTRDGTS